MPGLPFAIFLAFLATCVGEKQAIWLTALQPFTGGDWDAGVSMRIGAEIILEEINNHSDLLPGYELKVAWQDDMCNAEHGVEVFLQSLLKRTYPVFAPHVPVSSLDADGDGTITTADTANLTSVWNSTLVSPGPVGLLGPGCSGTAMGVSNIAHMSNFPIVSNSATRPSLSDRSAFPNFFRTIMPDTYFNAAWLDMAKMLGHTSVAAVCGETSNWKSMVEALVSAAEVAGVTLVGEDLTGELPGYHGYQITGDYRHAVAEVAEGLRFKSQRIVILQMFHPRIRLLLCEARKLGYVNVVWMVNGWNPEGWWAIPDTDCEPEAMTQMATGFISANMQFWRSDLQKKLDCSQSMTGEGFRDEWLTRQGAALDDLGKRPEGYVPALEAATTADAVCMYAQMLHQVLYVRGVELDSLGSRTDEAYRTVQEVFAATDFEGVTANIKFGENKADPDGSIIVQQMQRGRQVDIASFHSGRLTFLGLNNLTFGLPGERYFAGPAGASAIFASLTHFEECPWERTLNFQTNMCEACPDDQQYVDIVKGCTCMPGYTTSSSLSARRSQCLPCDPGNFSSSAGALRCEQCQRGRFAFSSAAETCQRCPVGRYAEDVGMSSCTPCPETFTTAGEGAEGPEECRCGAGARLGDDGRCVDCGQPHVDGLVCDGFSDVRIAPGFYAADESLSVFRCFGDSMFNRCKGGVPGDTCTHARTGIACAECTVGFRQHVDGSCSPCKNDGSASAGLALFCFLSCSSLVAVYIYIDRRRGSSQHSHSILLCALAASMSVTILQQLGILGLFKDIQWPRPMEVLLSSLTFVLVDLDFFDLTCVGEFSPPIQFFMTVCMVMFFVVVLVLVHVVSVVFFHQWNFAEHRTSLIACIGTVFTVFYISVVSAVLGPMQCMRHPNGKWTSVAYPSVVCWESGQHLAMVCIGMVALCIPLAYLAKCCQVVWHFRASMRAGRVDRLVAYRFLFFRYKLEAYWYSLVLLIRSLLLALLPVLPNVALQLLSMQLVLVVQLICAVQYKPWRVHSANSIEVLVSVVMIATLSMGALFVSRDSAGEAGVLLAWFFVGVILVALLFTPLAVCYGLCSHWRHQKRKPFQYFITHHKAGAGSFARLLKMTLQKDSKVFIDCDNLTNLDALFDQVANLTQTLIVVGSRELFLRPWCVGEIATAKLTGLEMIKVTLPDAADPPDDFIDNYAAHIGDLSTLANHGISLHLAQEAMRWYCLQRAFHIDEDLDNSTMDALATFVHSSAAQPATHRSVAVGELSGDMPEVGLSASLIVRDWQNLEATAAALILARLLTPRFSHAPVEIPQVLPMGEAVPAATSRVILLCTSGCFERPSMLRTMKSVEAASPMLLPIVVEEGFRFPTSTLIVDARTFVSVTTAEAEAEAKALAKYISDIFKTIAVFFPASTSSESTLVTKAEEIAQRLENWEVGAAARTKTTLAAVVCSPPSFLPSLLTVTSRLTHKHSVQRSHDIIVDLPV